MTEVGSRFRGLGRGGQAGDSVDNLTFSPDGNLLAIPTDSGVELLDVQTGHQLFTIKSGTGALEVAFSLDQTLLAMGTGGGIIQLWGLPNAP